MVIQMHIALVGTPPFRRKVKIEAAEGTTVRELLEIYRGKYKAWDILGSTRGISVLVNGVRGSFDRELKEGDSVKVFRPMIRG